MDGDDFKRQQVRHRFAFAMHVRRHSRHGGGTGCLGLPEQGQAERGAVGHLAVAGLVVRQRLRLAEDQADGQYRIEHEADGQADGPLGGADAHFDKRALRGEHDAEDDEDERAADVHEQLRGPDEIRAEQEEQTGDTRESEQEPGRRPDDVLRQHHGQSANARHHGEDVKQHGTEVVHE